MTASSRIIVAKATLERVRTVAAAMREVDAREIWPTTFATTPDEFAEEQMAADRFALAHVAFLNQQLAPIAILGAWLCAPQVAEVAMYATDDWPSIGRPVDRFVRQWFIPYVLDPNVVRAQCRCWEGHTAARRWLASLGFREEGLAPGFGGRGDTLVHLGRLRPGWSASPCATARS